MNADSQNASQGKPRFSSFLKHFLSSSRSKSTRDISEVESSRASSANTACNDTESTNQPGSQRSAPTAESTNQPGSQGSVPTPVVTYSLVKERDLTRNDHSALNKLREYYLQRQEGLDLVPDKLSASEVEEQGVIRVTTKKDPSRKRLDTQENDSLFIRYASGATVVAMPYTIMGRHDLPYYKGQVIARSVQETEQMPKDDWMEQAMQNGPIRATSKGRITYEPASAETQLRSRLSDQLESWNFGLSEDNTNWVISQGKDLISGKMGRFHKMVVAPRIRAKDASSHDAPSMSSSEHPPEVDEAY